MITAEKLKILTELGPKGLTVFLERSGYKNVCVKNAEFVGITNGGQFAYKVIHAEDEKLGKVFITYDHTTDKITADC